ASNRGHRLRRRTPRRVGAGRGPQPIYSV
ncbi:uncharacterized protein METZ01_LOCUS222105, partial [marine metagenome]